MSDDLDQISEPQFTSFIPLTILLAALIIWVGYSDYSLNQQRSGLNQQITAATPALLEAQNYRQHYLSLISDLNQTAQSDDVAKAIMNDALRQGLITEAIRAGLIHVQQGTNNAPTAPAPTGT
jgi:hypothetical protein